MQADSNDYYYVHDHLYSPAALLDDDGSVIERYEYDVYGKCHVLEPNFAADPDGKSDCGNPYYFTGRELDTLDENGLRIMYYRNRYYDPGTGRFLTCDPLGVTPNQRWPNIFGANSQYTDSLNLYEYAQSNPVMVADLFGLMSLTCGPFCDCDPHLFDEEEIEGCEWPGTWDPVRAVLHFLTGGGRPKIFCPGCPFTRRIASDGVFIRQTLRQTFEWLGRKAAKRAADIKPNSCKAVQITGWGAPYQFGHDWLLENTIGSGGRDRRDPWSRFVYNAKCCIKKPCCTAAYVDVNIECKVSFSLADKYTLDAWPEVDRIGTDFWTYVYFYKDFGPKNISVTCK